MNWNLKAVKGNRETVKAAVAADKNLPDFTKAFIAAQIDALPTDVTACRLDAYCQDLEAPADMRMQRRVEITVVGFKL